jgi:hypothetical protein
MTKKKKNSNKIRDKGRTDSAWKWGGERGGIQTMYAHMNKQEKKKNKNFKESSNYGKKIRFT